VVMSSSLMLIENLPVDLTSENEGLSPLEIVD